MTEQSQTAIPDILPSSLETTATLQVGLDPTNNQSVSQAENQVAQDSAAGVQPPPEVHTEADLANFVTHHRGDQAPQGRETIYKRREISPPHHRKHLQDADFIPGIAERPEPEQDLIGEVVELGQEAIGIPSRQFIEQKLGKDGFVRDSEGFPRPSFEIAGRRIIFRNRQETPKFSDRTWTAIGLEESPPLPCDEMDISPVHAYVNAEHEKDSRDADYLVVTNTPDGLVAGAKLLTSDEAQRQKLDELSSILNNKEYTNPVALELLDNILATMTVGDEGEMLPQYDTDGLAIELAALTGDLQAQALVNKKCDDLRLAESKRLQKISEGDAQWLAKPEIARRRDELGALTPDKVALVHSTAYDVERDPSGNIVLWSAAQKRDDALPRASLHFTLNSQVAPHAQAQDAWGNTNKLIVANLSVAMEANHRTPDVIDGVDTWFVANPGEAIQLPGALVVEGSAESEQLLENTEAGVIYLDKDEYSEAQSKQIDLLRAETGIGKYAEDHMTARQILKEVALRKALTRVGVPIELQDMPSSDGHGMSDARIDMRIALMAAELGVRSGTHFNHPEAGFEMQAYNMLRLAREKHRDWSIETGLSTALAMRRQVVAAGYIPANPPKPDKVFETMMENMVPG